MSQMQELSRQSKRKRSTALSDSSLGTAPDQKRQRPQEPQAGPDKNIGNHLKCKRDTAFFEPLLEAERDHKRQCSQGPWTGPDEEVSNHSKGEQYTAFSEPLLDAESGQTGLDEEARQLPTPSTSQAPPAGENGSGKRKLTPLLELSTHQFPQKRPCTDDHTCDEDCDIDDAISHWVRYSSWPQRFLAGTASMSQSARKKFKQSTMESFTPTSSTPESSTPKPTTPNIQSREERHAYYADSSYPLLLEERGIFMRDSEAQLPPDQISLCGQLLTSEQTPPSDTLFHDDLYPTTLRNIQNANESRVVRDIGLLVSASPEHLAQRGSSIHRALAESVDELWTLSFPVAGPRPKPDFSVGFRYTAFSKEHQRLLGLKYNTASYYTATSRILFPFFTTEVKCVSQPLDVADRQNAHSMTVAIRGIVALYRRSGRQKELDRKILGFSISHNHRFVVMYAHYPQIHEATEEYYRHQIKMVDLVADPGARWTPQQFTRNVYEIFMPKHLELIKEGIDALVTPAGELPLPQSTDVGGGSNSAAPITTASTATGNTNVLSKRSRVSPTEQMKAQIQTLEANAEAQLLATQEREGFLFQQIDNMRKEQARLVQMLESQHKAAEKEKADLLQQMSELIKLASSSVKA